MADAVGVADAGAGEVDAVVMRLLAAELTVGRLEGEAREVRSGTLAVEGELCPMVHLDVGDGRDADDLMAVVADDDFIAFLDRAIGDERLDAVVGIAAVERGALVGVAVGRAISVGAVHDIADVADRGTGGAVAGEVAVDVQGRLRLVGVRAAVADQRGGGDGGVVARDDHDALLRGGGGKGGKGDKGVDRHG